MFEQKITVADAHAITDNDAAGVIGKALDAVRDHFGMPVAYLSEISGEETIFRYVSAPGLEDMIRPGDRRRLAEVYCPRILSGDLPSLIPDTSALPATQDLAITREVPIGSHVSLPIEREDGTVYGMFCCLSPEPNPSLNDRDLKVMRAFARLAGENLRQLEARRDRAGVPELIAQVIREEAYDTVYQPIYSAKTGDLASFEALTRFRSEPYRPPNLWFDDARTVGRAQELEVLVIEKALSKLRYMPDGTRVSVNASPDTLASGALWPVLARHDPNRITIELTEHEQTSDLAAFLRACDRATRMGALMAVDDVGSGYSGLQKILRLRPNILKLDMSLVRDIDRDVARRALARALVHFARDTGADVTAEGVETAAEWSTLRDIGVTYGQGWHLGRPGSLAQAARRVPV